MNCPYNIIYARLQWAGTWLCLYMGHKDNENICLYDKIETERRQLKSEL